MKSWLKLAAFSLLFSVINAATAGTPGSSPAKHLQWQCWYDQGIHVRCMIDGKSSAANFEKEAAPTELPHLIQSLWADGLRKSTIRFTLDQQPADYASTMAFAKASVCGAYRNCGVILSLKPPTMKQYLSLLEKNDPSAAEQLAQALLNWGDQPSNTDLALAMAE